MLNRTLNGFGVSELFGIHPPLDLFLCALLMNFYKPAEWHTSVLFAALVIFRNLFEEEAMCLGYSGYTKNFFDSSYLATINIQLQR